MDGFTGFKTAAAEELPGAVAVMDPFHVVRLAGDALDRCRRRVQQDLHGHRGRKATRCTGPPHPAHRRDLLTDRQRPGSTRCSPTTGHVEVEATWGIYQRMIAAYRDPDREPAAPRHAPPVIAALSATASPPPDRAPHASAGP
jgi:hypothetical protein